MDKKSQRYFPNIKKIFKIKSIRGKFFLTIAICIIIPLFIVGIIASLLSSTTLFRSAVLNNQNFLKNLISVVDANVMDMDRLSKVTYSDTTVQAILAEQGNNQNLWGQLENSLKMDQLFQNLITIRENITGIYIFNLNGLLYEHFTENKSFNNDYDYKKEPWFANGVKANGGIVITGAHKPEYLNFFDQNEGSWQDQYVYSVFRQINSFSPHKALGYILIDQPLRAIDDIIKRMNLSEAKTIIIDENGNIVYEPSGGLINKNFLVLSHSLQPIQNSDNGYLYIHINRDKYLVTYQKSNYSNWKFISLIPYKVIMHDSAFLANATLIIGLICLFVSLIIASLVAYRITKPIKILLSGMKRVGKGDFEVLIEAGSGDEMAELTDSFNGMTKKIKNLIQSEYEAEIHQREAELNSLRNQINPHFLYNTLESIRTLAALNGDKDVSEMTYSLANLFRMSMSRGEKYVTLSHEVELIKHYTYIQRIRFNNKFTVQYDIPLELYNAQIPSFIMQPIVENSIKHGIDPKDDPGTIKISARVINKDILMIEISDDGVGMSEENLKVLNEYLYQLSKSKNVNNPDRIEKHVGLCNVNRRIHIYADEQYGLEIKSNDKGGVTARLILPLIYQI